MLRVLFATVVFPVAAWAFSVLGGGAWTDGMSLSLIAAGGITKGFP